MYQSFWQLRESPYRDGIDPRTFHAGAAHLEALARLQYLVDAQRRLGLLIGSGGTGKSFVLEVFAQQETRRGAVAARIDLLGKSVDEALTAIAAAWGLDHGAQATRDQLWRRIVDRLMEYRLLQRRAVLLVDNAEEADSETQLALRRLAQADSAPDAAMTLVLAARPERLHAITPRLLELAALRIDLASWEEDDTREFLDQGLKRAGRTTSAFDRAAISRLHELTGGNPRRVARLAELALVAGAGDRLQRIDAPTIDRVFEELAVGVV